jgi:hypothetical protein
MAPRPAAVPAREDHPGAGRAEQGVGQQGARTPHEAQVGEEHQPAAVDGVGQGAAEEGERQEGGHLDHAEEPHDQGGAGELEHLIGDGNVGDHRAEKRHRLTHGEEPVVPVAPQRRDVGGQGAPTAGDLLRVRIGWHLGRGRGQAFVRLGQG